jgi:hypothetical protein
MHNIMEYQFCVKPTLEIISIFVLLSIGDFLISGLEVSEKVSRKQQVLNQIESGELPKSLLKLVS